MVRKVGEVVGLGAMLVAEVLWLSRLLCELLDVLLMTLLLVITLAGAARAWGYRC